MTNAPAFIRTLLIYSICLPLAIFVGYLLSDPISYTSFFGIGLLLLAMLAPVLLRWHHFWLVATWNCTAVIFFLPGRPTLWFLIVWMSLGISVLQYALNRRLKFISVPSITHPLVLLAVVILATAELRGGIGMSALGSQLQGGKRYLLLLTAIAGYFAITSQQVSPRRAWLVVGVFFFGALTQGIGELAHLGGGPFEFLFLIFPLNQESFAALLNQDSAIQVGSSLSRLELLSPVGTAIFCYLLAKHGVKGVFDARHPGRFAVFILCILAGLLSGFRGTLVVFVVTFGILFYLEGLTHSRLLPAFILLFILGSASVLPFVRHLPLSIQRTVAFLPLDIDPVAKMSAQTTVDWRLQMWKDVLPQVPKYLLLGKGYTFDLNEAELMTMPGARGATQTEMAELAGDFHNGPLSTIIPLGIIGLTALIWFIVSSLKVLDRNRKFGRPEYQQINTFLFAYFLCKVIFFFTIFGSLYVDLAMFAGLVGLSISLNGGVAKAAPVEAEAKELPESLRIRRRSLREPVTA
ncbi:MAG TPA: O-antigen ligase family protein [Verrucomicrobiae bacterium]|nr:O-antigen ligase family protein [Verrucomicrobiae bacterium]